MRAGDPRTACDRFAESQQLEPSAGVTLNLAICEEQLDRWSRARRHYEQFLEMVPDDDDRRARATRALSSLAARMPRAHVALAAAWSEGAEVRVDGDPVDLRSNDGWMSLDPGEHVVSVTSRSPPARREVHILAEVGKEPPSIVIDAPLPPARPAQTPTMAAPPVAVAGEPSAPAATPLLRKVGVVAMSAGVVAVGAGVFFSIRAVQKKQESDGGCDSGNMCTPQAAPTRREAQAAGDNATLATVVGLALAAAGATMYVVARPKTAHQHAHLDLLPSIDVHGVGGVLAATF